MQFYVSAAFQSNRKWISGLRQVVCGWLHRDMSRKKMGNDLPSIRAGFVPKWKDWQDSITK
jgi:hypothetical protein